jgi:nucleoporin NUP159
MAEKRSADIDVLENHMRKLRLGSVGLNNSTSSREGSPFVASSSTPQQRRSMILSPEAMRNSFASSVASYGLRGTPPRKKMSMYSEEEKKAVQQKQTKRAAMLGLLRSSLEKSGPNISHLGDDD